MLYTVATETPVYLAIVCMMNITINENPLIKKIEQAGEKLTYRHINKCYKNENQQNI